MFCFYELICFESIEHIAHTANDAAYLLLFVYFGFGFGFGFEFVDNTILIDFLFLLAITIDWLLFVAAIVFVAVGLVK